MKGNKCYSFLKFIKKKLMIKIAERDNVIIQVINNNRNLNIEYFDCSNILLEG